jgi:hypothetical protein
MSKEFYNKFREHMRTWGEKQEASPDIDTFFRRLRGDNHFCRSNYQPDLQAQMRQKDGCRYTIINYCYALHGTIEVRLLPAFVNKNLAVSAIATVVNFFRSYLRKNNEVAEIEFTIDMEE